MAPPVSQLDTTLSTDRPAALLASLGGGGTPHRFSQVRTALIRALRSSPEAREPLCDALEQLEAIQQELEEFQRAMPPASAGAPSRPAAPRSRRGKSQEYEIQNTPDGSFLTERRAGHSQPFRCPRSTYDAAAEVLAAAPDALPFEELMERLNTRTGHRQPDYRLRVALRFWMTHQAVVRSRTKYRPADRAQFLPLSQSLWTQTEHATSVAVAPAHG
jgi:hypothetical protein